MNTKLLEKRLGRKGAIKYLLKELKDAESNPGDGKIVKAIQQLGEIKAVEALDRLEELAVGEKSFVRECCLASLLKIDEDRAFPLIKEAVLEEKNKWVRSEYAEMLGECSSKKEEAKRVLKEVLNDEKVEVRLKAASSLAKHGDTSGHRVALEVVEKELYDEDIRKEAVEILGEIGVNDEETIEAIKNYERETCVGRQTLERLGVRTRHFE